MDNVLKSAPSTANVLITEVEIEEVEIEEEEIEVEIHKIFQRTSVGVIFYRLEMATMFAFASFFS